MKVIEILYQILRIGTGTGPKGIGEADASLELLKGITNGHGPLIGRLEHAMSKPSVNQLNWPRQASALPLRDFLEAGYMAQCIPSQPLMASAEGGNANA